MPTFTIETAYYLPVFRHQTVEAGTVEEACRLAVADDDWSGERLNYETAGQTHVSSIWSGADAAYRGTPIATPSEFRESITRKADHFEVLLGLLKVLAQDRDLDSAERGYWQPRAALAIAKAEAILAGEPDPSTGDALSAGFVIARVINDFGEVDYLCGWDPEWGTSTSLSLARALRFADLAQAEAACEQARSLVPMFVDGRTITYRVIPEPY